MLIAVTTISLFVSVDLTKKEKTSKLWSKVIKDAIGENHIVIGMLCEVAATIVYLKLI